ncbi:LytR/AlgR family response regulator transcription factor [Flavobacterium sp.]|uniref:LytR/AlgR family response regulator transcription factor n=1 Tax=Flavobacterium sp. TaxID=239 RepID=UPI0039E4097E
MNFWKQKDVKLFLVLVPVFTFVTYLVTYSGIVYDSGLAIAFAIDTANAYITWLGVRFIIKTLEQQSKGDYFSSRQFIKLFLFTFIGGVGVTIVLPNGHPYITGNRYAKDQAGIWTHDLLIFLMWIVAVNFIYILMRYYEIWQQSEQRLADEKTLKTEGINLKIGDKNVKFSLKEIHGFFVEDGFTYLINADFKTFIVDSSLDNLEQKLPERYFFRVNRKFILHRNAIVSFKRIEDSKLLLTTLAQKPLPDSLPMSRLKAPAFKKWFEQDAAAL